MVVDAFSVPVCTKLTSSGADGPAISLTVSTESLSNLEHPDACVHTAFSTYTVTRCQPRPKSEMVVTHVDVEVSHSAASHATDADAAKLESRQAVSVVHDNTRTKNEVTELEPR
eukprot:2038018-Rhodomonas_salina.5